MTSEESATPDLVELMRSHFEAGARGDFDEIFESYAPDALYDMSRFDLGVFHGPAAIRAFIEDWVGMFEGLTGEAEEVRGLGSDVVLLVYHQEGRPLGSSGLLSARGAQVIRRVDGLIAGVTVYPDIDEARAAAERLAEERE
jgi:ketosteroid isomerase-like protein